jgi:hypothetical protein
MRIIQKLLEDIEDEYKEALRRHVIIIFTIHIHINNNIISLIRINQQFQNGCGLL